MEFVAHEMVNILQNISQNRPDKKITANDIRYAASTAYLSIYPGTTMWCTTKNNPWKRYYGHCPTFNLYAVRVSNEKASVLWYLESYWHAGSTKPSEIGFTNSHAECRTVNVLSNVPPAQIHQKLSMQNTEMKIILECFLYYEHHRNSSFVDGRSCADVPAGKALGFNVVTPKCDTAAKKFYFTTIIIFTPKPGLFDGTAPQ
jgi:hypothetical protein